MELNQKTPVEVSLECADYIHQVLNGEFAYFSDLEKKLAIKRNVDHLKLIISGSYIDLKQFSKSQLKELQKAIDAGNAYVTSL